MDLNSNPGLSLYITVMNTNTFASGLDRLITMAVILLDFALSLVSVTTEGKGWKDFSDSFTCLKLKTQSLQMSCKWLSVLIEKVSFPHAVHSSCQQMGVLQVTVHSLCLLQLWFQMSSLWCLHSWFSCCCGDIAAASFLRVHYTNICKHAQWIMELIFLTKWFISYAVMSFYRGLCGIVLTGWESPSVSWSLVKILISIFNTFSTHRSLISFFIEEMLLSGATYYQGKIRAHYNI